LSTHTSADILISIDTIDQLFNGSSINPFSDKTAVILGEAGLPYAIRQELGRGLRSWQGKRLIIRLPPDQIGADLQLQVTNAIRKYAGIFAGLVTIFIWSTVWNPWDRLVYEWIEPWRENRILRSLTKMEIVIQSEPIVADHTRLQI
jgi:hypothetical protein